MHTYESDRRSGRASQGLLESIGSVCRWTARVARAGRPTKGWWIVSYHEVSDDDRPPRQTVSVEAFQADLELLSRGYQIIGLDEGFARLVEGAIDAPLVSITFDGGYAGVVDHAYPLLEQRGWPASLFVCGAGLVADREPWHVGLRRLLQAGRAETAALALGIPLHALHPTLDEAAVKRRWTPEAGERLVELAREVEDPPPARLVSIETLRGLDPAILRIGNLTWRHAVLSRLDSAELVEEIGRTEELITTLPGYVPVLAVPFGQPEDLSRRAATVARTHFGLRLLTAHGGVNTNFDRGEEAARRAAPADCTSPA